MTEQKDIKALEQLRPYAERYEAWAIKALLQLKQSPFPKVRQAAAQIVDEINVGP